MAQLGSFRYNFAQKSKQKLLSNLDDDHDDEGEDKGGFCSCGWFGKVRDWIRLGIWWSWLRGTATNVWDFGRSDPRKVVFAAKMGLALTLLSFLIFLKEPFESLSRYSVWAILTVVVVFEFSIGATLSKGFNRGLGTLFAGGLALAVAELSVLTGDWEEFVIIIGIYIAGFVTNFLKLYPTMKPYEYGFRVFLITFCFIVVSGYRTGTFVETAVNRFLLICLGASVALAVNIFIYPIWAGEDFHKLVAKNFDDVAKSLEGCVNGYLQCVEYKRIPSKILRYEVSDDLLYSGYRSAVESKSQEDALLGFAIWEPPHGPYNMFNYPWKSYVKVSGALRHCAFAVMALHGCILSEIQAPPQRRQVFSNELQKVGIEGAKVLRELGSKLSAMTRLSSIDILSEVHDAVEELQNKIDRRSYLLVNSESWEIGNRTGHTGNEQGHTVVPERDAHHLVGKSQSEALLDLSYIQIPKSWDFDASGNSTPSILEHQESTLTTYPQEAKFQKQTSFLSRQSFHQDASVVNVGESKTYESASALSLATFSSLLIEFVARLSFLVDSFEELSNKAKFKEPVEGQPQGSRGFWARLCRCFL